ncbi:hypothetical protein EVAR_98232_1 [Eumeta japonica]|uniref:Uncharacterized protein n=1 Tax=Eumeta variegata TaxID=151549 RepID=A0A4C1Y2W5_EUMVA|nr:hypothetical protein EVAR_98232_1 [Eumeta japonica]
MEIYLYDLKEYESGLRMDKLTPRCLLYADDQVVLAPSACGLQKMLSKMNDSVKKRDIKVNAGKTNVMVFERSESTNECDILIEDRDATKFNFTRTNTTGGGTCMDVASVDVSCWMLCKFNYDPPAPGPRRARPRRSRGNA